MIGLFYGFTPPAKGIILDSQDVPERRHSVTPKKSIEDGIDKGKS